MPSLECGYQAVPLPGQVRSQVQLGNEAKILALVPVATHSGHWKNHVFGVATAVCFLYDTRLCLLVNGEDGGKGAPMSCAMIYWGRHYQRFQSIFNQFGAVVNLAEMKATNRVSDTIVAIFN